MKPFEYNKLIKLLQIINNEDCAKNILEINCIRDSDYVYLEFLTINYAQKFYFKYFNILNMEYDKGYIITIEYRLIGENLNEV